MFRSSRRSAALLGSIVIDGYNSSGTCEEEDGRRDESEASIVQGETKDEMTDETGHIILETSIIDYAVLILYKEKSKTK